MKKIVLTIDSINEFAGKVTCFLVVGLIIILCYEVISRYVFNNPTIWVLETSKMIMGIFSVCGWSYAYLHDKHVRVDIFYSNFSRRGKAWVNVIMLVIFLIPFNIITIFVGIKKAAFAYKIGQKMIESSWCPPAAPILTVLVIGFSLFGLQSISQFIQELYFLIRKGKMSC